MIATEAYKIKLNPPHLPLPEQNVIHNGQVPLLNVARFQTTKLQMNHV